MDSILLNGLAFWNSDIEREEGLNYLSSLPEDVQEAINQHPEKFHSAEELKAYADRLLLRS